MQAWRLLAARRLGSLVQNSLWSTDCSLSSSSLVPGGSPVSLLEAFPLLLIVGKARRLGVNSPGGQLPPSRSRPPLSPELHGDPSTQTAAPGSRGETHTGPGAGAASAGQNRASKAFFCLFLIWSLKKWKQCTHNQTLRMAACWLEFKYSQSSLKI